MMTCKAGIYGKDACTKVSAPATIGMVWDEILGTMFSNANVARTSQRTAISPMDCLSHYQYPHVHWTG